MGLDGDVEGGGGFVGDDELGLEDEAHGDHDALLHAAGELVGVGADGDLGILDADLAEPFESFGAGGVAGEFGVVDEEGLDDLVADADEGGEGGHGVLEDDADAFAAEFAHLLDGELEEVSALEEDLAGEGRRRGMHMELTDLPQPDSPTMQRISPRWTSKETSWTVVTALRVSSFSKAMVRCLTWRRGCSESDMAGLTGVC